jgi:hypothetical protein
MEMIIEVLSLIGAIIGIITALIKRKQIVIHVTDAGKFAPTAPISSPITFWRRVRRFLVCFVLALVLAGVSIALQRSQPAISTFIVLPLLAGALVLAFYQLTAIVLMGLVRLWSQPIDK